MKYFNFRNNTLVTLFCCGIGLAASLTNTVHTGPELEAVIWTFDTGGRVFSTPCIHDHVVYMGSADKKFYALDAQSGEKLWEFNTANVVRSTAVVDSGVVCFESGNVLYGLDLAGNLLWTFDLYTEFVHNAFDDWDYFHSSPVVYDGIAYVGTEKGLFYGIDMQTGEQMLKIQTPNTAYGIRVAPVIADRIIYFGDWNGYFYAYDLTSGEKVWSYSTKEEKLLPNFIPAIQSRPVIYNGTVCFAGRGCILYGLDAATGEKKWTHKSPTSEWLVGGLVLDDSLLFMGSSNQKLLHAVNANTGRIVWQTRLVDGRIFGVPCVYDDYVFAGSGYDNPASGSLWVLDKATGDIRNQFPVGDMVLSSPVIADGVVYFGCGNGTIYALDAEKTCNIPRPEIKLDSTVIELGDISNSESECCVQILVRNTGSAKEFIESDWFGFFIDKAAIALSPDTLTIAPGDEQALTVMIDATQLDPGRNTITVTLSLAHSVTHKTITVSIKYNVVDVTGVTNAGKQPLSFALDPIFPNPFNPAANISFAVPEITDVNVAVYNIQGQLIDILYDNKAQPGEYLVTWNGTEQSSGTYFVRMNAGDFCNIRKCLLIK